MYLRSIIQLSCPTTICSSRSTRISHVMTLCCIACQICSMSWDMNCINSILSFIILYSLLILGLFIGISRPLLVSSHIVLYIVHLFSVSHPNLSFYLCLSYPRSDFYILLNQENSVCFLHQSTNIVFSIIIPFILFSLSILKSSNIFPFSLMNSIKKFSICLTCLFIPSRLPVDFNISDDLSLNGDIYDYQTKIYKLFQTIIKSVQQYFLQDLQTRFDQLEQYFQYSTTSEGKEYDWRTVEVLYHVVYYLGDSNYKGMLHLVSSMFLDSIQPFVLRILNLYSAYPHHSLHTNLSVLSILQEVVYRFTSLLVLHQEYYTPSALLYVHGIQCEDHTLQKRSAYLLNKFVHKIYIHDQLLNDLTGFMEVCFYTFVLYLAIYHYSCLSNVTHL